MSVVGTMHKFRLLFATVILSSALSGCATMIESAAEAVVEAVVHVVVVSLVGAAVACIDNDRPVIEGALPNPVLNRQYNGLVHVGIRNEPYDDSYDYKFELLGNFPPGMRTESAGRQVKLVGTPTMPGVYNFKVRVKVEDEPNGARDTKGLCSTIDIEGFQWTIQDDEYKGLTS